MWYNFRTYIACLCISLRSAVQFASSLYLVQIASSLYLVQLASSLFAVSCVHLPCGCVLSPLLLRSFVHICATSATCDYCVW